MAENQTFIPAPPGLIAKMKGGVHLPIVAFRVEEGELFPYYAEIDGSIGTLPLGTEVTAAWIPPAVL